MNKMKIEIMKKIFAVILSISFIFIISGCNKIKKYNGLPIDKLTVETIDYMGGFRSTYIFDFVNNNVSKNRYSPREFEEKVFEVVATFTDKEEKSFLDQCYSYGLFNLQEHYIPEGIILDGGGWNLLIEYADGTTKTSDGDNAGPTDIFNDCAIVFYELCQERVIGYIPNSYFNPPQVEINFLWENGINQCSDNRLSRYARLNYKWNGFESMDNDIYSISNKLNPNPKFEPNIKYRISFSTINNYEDTEKFKKFILKCYDMNEDLTNEKIVLSKKWFKSVKTELELNKIYVIELTYKDGDFVQYTFNTLSCVV